MEQDTIIYNDKKPLKLHLTNDSSHIEIVNRCIILNFYSYF